MASQRLNYNAAQTALCTVMAAALVAGCASSGSVAMKRSASEPGGKIERVASRDLAKAEADVAKQPQVAAARITLANAYLGAGRFESAVTTFEDARQLGDSSARTALSLALAHIATGNNAEAVSLLDQSRDVLAHGDYGLALALAGETGRGVEALANALRSGENTVKVRQNLAYAYALDGRWPEARVMAAQDVPADQLDARISEWARQGKPEDYRVRVASMLGAPVMVDSGQPAHLALGRSSDTALAVADTPAPTGELPPVEKGESFWLAEMTPSEAEPVPVARAEVAAAPATNSFDTAFAGNAADRSNVSRPVVQAVPARVATAETAQRRSRPVERSRNLVPGVKETVSGKASGSHLVQLGSFTSPQNADRAWSAFVSRNPELKKFDKTVSQAMVGGKKYWRVSAGGFEKAAARQMCSTVKSRGGACIAWSPANPLPGAIARN